MKKHNRTIMKIILPIVLLAFLVSCQQSPKMKISGDLEIGVEQFGNLQKKTPKSFEIQLDSNAFVLGVVNQKTVDVVVKLFNEANEEIGSFDGPATGPERFSFSVDKTGAYRLEVIPFKDESGEYSIQIDKVEPIASDPAKRVDQLLVFYSNNEPGAVIGVIENGEMTTAVVRPTIETTTLTFWMAVDGVSKTVDFESATCGKGDPMQGLPVFTGGPMVRLRGVYLK